MFYVGPTISRTVPAALPPYTPLAAGIAVEADLYPASTWWCGFVAVSGLWAAQPALVVPPTLAVGWNATTLMCDVPSLPPGEYALTVAAADLVYFTSNITVTVPAVQLLSIAPSYGLLHTAMSVTITATYLPPPPFVPRCAAT